MNSLDGMFAFICLDTSLSKIFVARDRFGEKPLYYYEDNGEIFFASETRILQNLVSDKLQIDLNSIYRFIKFEILNFPINFRLSSVFIFKFESLEYEE